MYVRYLAHGLRFGALTILLATGCSQPVQLAILNPELAADPSGNAPLTALCTFTTEVPTKATITIDYGDDSIDVAPEKEFSTDHKVPVLGLRPETTHAITVHVEDESGNRGESEPMSLITSALTEDLPPVELVASEASRMEPGITVIPLMRWPKGRIDDKFGLIIAVNEKGEIVWYYRADHSITETIRLANGNIAYMPSRDGQLVEIDMLGNIVNYWYSTGVPKEGIPENAIPVETDTFHHDFIELPNGNFMTLSTEARKFDNYPTSETDPNAPTETRTVIGDIVIEFQRDGKIVRQFKIFDVLDPYRINYGSLQTQFWAQVYAKVLEKPGMDWAHGNSLNYIPEEDAVILSYYHQDLVMKFDLKTSSIKWMMGDHSGWKEPWQKYLLTPKGDVQWNHHQHAARMSPNGTLTMFDNGTNGVIAPAKAKERTELYSRAVEFKIDEAAMTVEQVWHFGGPDGERFFSPFICDVDWLPQTQNLLVTDGGRVKLKDGTDAAAPFGGKNWGRIIEVTHTTPPEKVFEIKIESPADDDTGWAIYRSQRMAGLYP